MCPTETMSLVQTCLAASVLLHVDPSPGPFSAGPSLQALPLQSAPWAPPPTSPPALLTTLAAFPLQILQAHPFIFSCLKALPLTS